MTDSPAERPDVMLLAAGLGKRLRPLTDTTSKPLIAVGGVRLIDRVVANAMAEGFRRFVVNTHHHAGQMAAHVTGLARAHPALSFAVSEEDVLLDTGGGIKRALPYLAGDPILAMNCDAFWPAESDRPLGRMVEAFATGGADIVLLCAQPRRATGFRRSHDFCLDPRGRITNDTGAPVIYAGVALLARRLVEGVGEEKFSLLKLFDAALEAETLRGVVLDAPWLHVGDPQALAEVEAVLAR